MDVKNDEKLQQWFQLRDLSLRTQETYQIYMREFCTCINKTPTELIEEAITETRQGLLLSERKTVGYISKFKKCIKDKGLAPKTQGVAMATIKSFYNAFDIQLSSSIGKTKKSLPLRENQNFLSKPDIIKMIANAASLRDKAIFLTMVTSGTSRQEIVNLKFSDIKYDDNGIGIIDIRRQKSQVDYTTFISPEAVLALKNYIDERNRIEKLKPKSNDDYIFVTYDFGKKLQLITFSFIFSKLAKALGYTNGKYLNKIRSHALRKFFASTLENAGMPKNKIDFMLGHSPSGNDLAYFKTDIEPLKQLYIKHLPYITFEKTIEVRSLDTQDAKKLEELEIRNKELEKQLEQKDAVVETLKERMDTFEGNYEYFEGYMKEFYEHARPPGLMPVKPVQLKDMKKSKEGK